MTPVGLEGPRECPSLLCNILSSHTNVYIVRVRWENLQRLTSETSSPRVDYTPQRI